MRPREIYDRLFASYTQESDNNKQVVDDNDVATCWRDAEGEKRLSCHLSELPPSNQTKDFSDFIRRQKALDRFKDDVFLTQSKFRIWHGFAHIVRELEIEAVILKRDVYDSESSEQADDCFKSINIFMPKLASLVLSDNVDVASQLLSNIRQNLYSDKKRCPDKSKQRQQALAKAVNTSEANSEAKFFAMKKQSLVRLSATKSSGQLNGK